MTTLLHFSIDAYTLEQIADLKLVAPYRDTRKIVESRLEHYVPPPSVSASHGGGWLTVTGVPVFKLQSQRPPRRVVPNLPAHPGSIALHGLVKTVAPTTLFGSPRTLRQTSRKRSGGGTAPPSRRDETDDEIDEAVTPSYLRSLYKTSTYWPAAWT
ncbi:hypothetical protein EDB86DRAFT_3100383 [Lactarius hatsudake]|nr:hypothetical protein EDB86DRAFT_3100383 [Lactarius hatsudake]